MSENPDQQPPEQIPSPPRQRGWGQTPPPPPPPDAVPEQPTNMLAVWSMVSGILGVALFVLWPIAWIGSVLAVVLGLVARGQVRERGQRGDGFSIAGIALGWVGVAIWVIAFGIIAAVFVLGTYAESFFVTTCDVFPADGTSTAACN